MILGEEKADIPTYFNDDEPRKCEKNIFSRIRIILLNLRLVFNFTVYDGVFYNAL